MKLIAVSDLHGILPDFLPEGDVLTISGDLSPCRGSHSPIHQLWWMENQFTPYCLNLLDSGKFKDIVYIAGNHDFWAEYLFEHGKMENKFKSELPQHIHYLRDSSVIIDGITFYGTPWTPPFCDWAFLKKEDELDNIFAKIPEGVDVLLSHGPPRDYCDVIEIPRYISQMQNKDHLGSHMLTKHILRAMPKLVVVGHIHTGSHKLTKILFDKEDFSKYGEVVNVSILDEGYEPFYKEIFRKEIINEVRKS